MVGGNDEVTRPGEGEKGSLPPMGAGGGEQGQIQESEEAGLPHPFP